MTSFSDYFLAYWGSWMIELIVITVAFIVVLYNWKKIARLTMSHMLLMAVLIWIAGVSIYSIGFAYEGSGGSLTAFLLRAAQASLGMFLSENELVEVSHHYKNSIPYMMAFTLIHVSALFLSTIFVINTIGFRLKNYFLVRHLVRSSSQKDVAIHFFWGLTDESFCMAEDIRQKYPLDRIVFMRSSSESEIGERLEVTQMIGSSSSFRHSLSLRKKVESIDDAVVYYVPDDKSWLNNRSIRKILRNSSKLNFYTFTAEEKMNLKLGGDVFNDQELCEATDKSITVNTLATRGGKNRIVEDYISLKMSEGRHIKWHILDRPYLSVRALRLDSSTHPVTSLREGSVQNGAVDGTFVAVIIGFGQMGQQMFRHLYEFSSFIGKDGKPAPKKFVIVDPDMNTKAGQFCISNPSFFHTDSIKILSSEIGSVQFWLDLKEYAGEVNSVSIALDDDEKNLDITMDLYRGILQNSSRKPQNVKIFMQMCSSENDATIRQLGRNYNLEKDMTGIEIITFGSVKDVFNCDVVMAKDVLRNARMFNYSFDTLRGVNLDCSPEEAWKRDYALKDFMEQYKFAPLALEMYYSRVNQCNSDYSHIGTILALAGVAPEDSDTLQRYVDIIHRRDAKSDIYTGASKAFQSMMDNLARCAHNRLVTSNWLQGYRRGNMSDINVSPMEAARQKFTPHMTPWEECDSLSKLLAYTVVDTSFIIALSECGSESLSSIGTK